MRKHLSRNLMALALVGFAFSVAPYALADDASICLQSNGDAQFAACNRVIAAGSESDDALAVAYSKRGEAYVAKGDPNHAMSDFNDAIRLDPRYAAAFVARGSTYLREKTPDRALPDLNEAIRLDPRYAPAFAARGMYYRQSGEIKQAIADFSEAIRLEPTLAAVFINRGLAYVRVGDLLNARSDFRSVLALAPKGDFGRVLMDTALEQLSALPGGGMQSAGPATKPPDIRVALVIGNSGYSSVPRLANPTHDSELVASSLRKIGFDVTVANDLTHDELIADLRKFAVTADHADWAVVYYAGHGIEMGGENFIVPIDAKLAADRDVSLEAVSLNQVLSSIDGAKKLRLVLLDACRNNPFINQMRRTIATRAIGRGLGRVEPDVGSLVVFAAKAGEVALDGDETNGPFAKALSQRINTPGLEVRRFFDVVRDDVLKATDRRQQPFSYGSISGDEDFYFVANK